MRFTSQHSSVGRMVLTVTGLCLAASLIAQQPDHAKAEGLARRAGERLQSLQREADQLASDEKTLLNELRTFEVQRQIKTEELSRITEEADAAASELAAATDRIVALENRAVVERPDVRARLVEMYKLGRVRYLRMMLSTSDVRQLGRAARLVAALMQLDRERVATHQRTLDSLKTARIELDERTRRMRTLRAEAERAEASAAASARSRSELIREIDRRRDLNAQLTGELQAAQQKLQLTLRDLGNGLPVAEAAALPLRPFRGALEWPATGGVRRRPGPSTGPSAAESAGIEIAAVEGTPVHAIHDGLVAFADMFSGFGNLVILDHGAQAFSLYGDLLETLVKSGARVERGQTVGRVGNSPAGPAGLYFELRIDGRPVDPLQWLKKPW